MPIYGATAKQLKEVVMHTRFSITQHVSKEAWSLINQILTVDSMQSANVEQITGHPWLSRGEEYSPSRSSEPLPSHLDSSIVAIMFDMGYDPYNTWASLAS